MSTQLPVGYKLQIGSRRQRATLVKFMQLSYQELFPQQDNFSHLAETIEKYFFQETPLWWVDRVDAATSEGLFSGLINPVACLWMGNAINQVQGDRLAHIFLLYVMPEYRRQGIGSALMRHAEDWARVRGDRQLGLQVFQNNQPALNLYHRLGYQTESLWMIKNLSHQ